MNLDDPSALRLCKPENLERLARALKAPLPEPGPRYELRLRRVVAHAIQADSMKAMAEERRMKDEAEALRVAMTIAGTLGENGARQIAQIRRIVALMGAEWTRDVLAEAEQYRGCETIGHNFRKDGVSRTFGGSFFATAKDYGSAALANGTITRREFFRCFTDRPPKPRTLPSRPAAKATIAIMESPAEAPPDPYHVMHRTRGGKGPVGRLRSRKAPEPVVEYVATRRRSG